MLQQGSRLALVDTSNRQHRAALTPDSVANFREIKPAISFHSWVPNFLNWHTLHDNRNAGEQRDNNSGDEATPDKPNLDPIPHDSKKKHANSQFTHADNHDSRHLTEQFILDGFDIYDRITDLGARAS